MSVTSMINKAVILLVQGLQVTLQELITVD